MALDQGSSRIMVLVNTVSEAHQSEPALLVLGLADEFLDIATVRDDLFQHVHAGLVGTTMGWSPEGTDTG